MPYATHRLGNLYDQLVAQATSGTETYAQKLDRLLKMNSPIRFAPPNKWSGNKPVYFTEDKYAAPRIDAKAWLLDPAGYSGTEVDFLNWSLTDAPVGQPAQPVAWTLPAYTGPSIYLQTPAEAAALEAQFGTAGVNNGSETYEAYVIRTNGGKNPDALPPATISASKGDASTVLDPSGRYLINGQLVDATGKALDTPESMSSDLSTMEKLLAAAAGGWLLYSLLRSH